MDSKIYSPIRVKEKTRSGESRDVKFGTECGEFGPANFKFASAKGTQFIWL